MSSMAMKGTREGITISVGKAGIDELLTDLGIELDAKAAFLRGSKVTLEASARTLQASEIERMSQVLVEHGLRLEAVVTEDEATGEAAQELGLRVAAPVAARQPSDGPNAASVAVAKAGSQRSPLEGSRGILVKHVVRSGRVVRHQGHVVVMGDVNPGGEIVAGGDIVVWGSLRGTAHAGAFGDGSAVIAALDMQPLQLRIAQMVARPDESAGASKGPEVARVVDESIVVEPWAGRS